jgi:DNA polymerase-3 subunit epsilon
MGNDMTEEILLESMVDSLSSTGNYRVLRRLGHTIQMPFVERCDEKARIGIFLDCETTGFEKTDEVIELAMVKFEFSPQGMIFGVGETFQGYRDPSKPIRPEITALTGITAEKVAGQKIDEEEVRAFIGDAAVIIAHHAGFDRPFSEGLCDAFAAKPWACSANQMDWTAEGIESAKLGYLAYETAFFYDKHRAVEDCMAGIAIIGAARKTCASALEQILKRARQPSWRVWAEKSPFETKDVLKARNYTWNDGSDGRPKSWFIDVDDVYAETKWLFEKVYGRHVGLRCQKITALERFSARPLPFDEYIDA